MLENFFILGPFTAFRLLLNFQDNRKIPIMLYFTLFSLACNSFKACRILGTLELLTLSLNNLESTNLSFSTLDVK